MFKWILRLLAVLVLAVLGLFVYGGFVPAHHVASASARYKQPPEVVWAALADVQHFREWRGDLKSVEKLPDVDGRPHWRETGEFGTLEMKVTESDPPNRMATELVYAAGEKPDFTGAWTYELKEDGDGTRLTLTERGAIHNRLFRGLAHLFFGYHSTQEEYLQALGRKFDEYVLPERGEVSFGS